MIVHENQVKYGIVATSMRLDVHGTEESTNFAIAISNWMFPLAMQ